MAASIGVALLLPPPPFAFSTGSILPEPLVPRSWVPLVAARPWVPTNGHWNSMLKVVTSKIASLTAVPTCYCKNFQISEFL